MPEWSSGNVVANGVRIHYSRTGGDKPALVLSHGATDSGLCWTRVARLLESDYDVILPDARGHGLSDAPRSGYASSDRAADLAGVIDALGVQRPAVGGHSMGAATTLRLIADYPDLASCAILEDPPFRSGEPNPLPPGHEEPRAALRRVVLEAQADDLDATIARRRAASPTWAEEEFEPWAEAKRRVSRAFLDDLTARGSAEEWRELLPRVRCPVLLLTSDPELGSIVTPDVAQEATRLLPSLQVVRVSGAGHNIRREQFEAFVREVRDFLAATYTPAALQMHHEAH
ncbi:MAG: alpha/beta hydrolase [Chloroflexota bacterium]|nr:alpha/beta hydrolase [Chloroflexota bacterium]